MFIQCMPPQQTTNKVRPFLKISDSIKKLGQALSVVPIVLVLQTAPTLAQSQDTEMQLIDQAANRVLQRFNNRLPANVKSHLVNEINKITGQKLNNTATATAATSTSTTTNTSNSLNSINTLNNLSSSTLLQKIDQALPQKFMDKLPVGVKARLSTVSTNKFENLSYWPGLNDPAHQLSIYTPKASAKKFPLIIYIHGGGWYTRPKAPPTWVSSFVNNGFAVAVVHYRLSQEGIFPAQIEDLDTALRWLKVNADKFNIDSNRIGLWGTSAGGHLAALMGTAWNSAALDLGPGDKSVSRQVQAVCDFCGPADLVALGSKMMPGQTWDTVSPMAPLSLLLGGPATNKAALAAEASPTTYASASAPPFLIVHGAVDPIVPTGQSEELANALKAAGTQVMFQTVPGAGHDIEKGGNIELARQFFKNTLNP